MTGDEIMAQRALLRGDTEAAEKLFTIHIKFKEAYQRYSEAARLQPGNRKYQQMADALCVICDLTQPPTAPESAPMPAQ